MASLELRSLRSVSPLTSHYEEVPNPGQGKSSGVVVEEQDNTTTAPHTGYPRSFADPQPRKQSLYNRLATSSWSLEVLSWLLAAVSLAVLIIVLASFNGKPLSQWHSGITPNTVLNMLTTIGATALIFPVASCIAQMRWLWMQKRERATADIETFGSGPIDSLRMILKHPKWFLTYLGAANVILIILYGPITQEMIQLGLQEKHLDLGSGSIIRNLVYQISSPPTDTVDLRMYQQDPDGSTDAILPSVARQMEASIVQALTQLPADPSEVRGECQTGNCTYGIYTTMGVCSYVENKTSTIMRRCFEAGEEHQTQTHCTYSVKALQAHPTTNNDNMTTRGDDSTNLWIGASYVDPGPHNAYSFPGPNTLAEFYVIYYPDPSVKYNSDAGFNATAALVALKGTLSLCVYQYNTTMINGITTTTEVNQPNVNWKTVSKVIDNTQITAISGTDVNNTEYWISEDARWAFNKYLTTETFYGTGKTKEDTSQPDKIITQGDTDAARSLSAVLIDQKGGVDGLSKFLDNLATGMTNGLRTTADQKDTVSGISTLPEVHIFISFRWLTAPILSIVLSLIFLLAVIVSTSQAGIPPWKGSQVLPLLSLGQSARDKLSMIDKKCESLEQLAREMKLKLVRTEDSWRLD